MSNMTMGTHMHPAPSGFSCPICQKGFTVASTLKRHARQCLEKEISTPRQKSCILCSQKKLKCDRKHPECSRCTSQGSSCRYVALGLNAGKVSPSPFPIGQSTPASSDLGSVDRASTSVTPDDQSNVGVSAAPSIGSSQSADPADRQMETGEVQSHDPILTYLCRIFRTYPTMLATCERLPPFVHVSQPAAAKPQTPLVNCLALCRMWANGPSGDFILTSIRAEMAKLLEEYQTYEEETLVAAFQASIVYAIILLFPVPQQPPTRMLDLRTVAALQEMGMYIRASIVQMPEELSRTRPSWEQWVLVTCKRRSLICFYCFEWMNAMLNSFASFPCNNADFMPAPAGKVLWSLADAKEWEVAYNRWLGRWAGLDIYTLGDLANMSLGPTTDLRSEMWLEEVDELGTLLMTVGIMSQQHSGMAKE